MNENKVFPIITKGFQKLYEKDAKENKIALVYTPEICGYYGRACRQMEKEEGANRALCMRCQLSKYCKDL
jgi:hypothetical protein